MFKRIKKFFCKKNEFLKLCKINKEFLSILSYKETIRLFNHLLPYMKIKYANNPVNIPLVHPCFNEFFSTFEEVIIEDVTVSYNYLIEHFNDFENFCSIGEENGEIFIKKTNICPGIFIDDICSEEELKNNDYVDENIYVYMVSYIAMSYKLRLEEKYLEMNKPIEQK